MHMKVGKRKLPFFKVSKELKVRVKGGQAWRD
jgi:nucleoid DNA-binding protein